MTPQPKSPNADLDRLDALRDAYKRRELMAYGRWREELERLYPALSRELRELRERVENAERRAAEDLMLAHQWMKAHDALKAGEPYEFPAPTDLPEVRAENERLRAAIKETQSFIRRTNHLSVCNKLVPVCATCGVLVTIHKDRVDACGEYKDKGCNCGRDVALLNTQESNAR